MKRVFSSHSEVAHVWAQQTQDEGRAGNIFFRDTTKIYSYGFHYLMAQVHSVNGKRFALVNSCKYSSSTCKHLWATRDALDGLMPYFEVDSPSSIRDAEADLLKRAEAAVDELINRRVLNGDWYSPKERLADAIKKFETVNEFRALIGKEPMEIPSMEFVLAHLQYLDERRKEREAKANTPEEIERKKIEREKREEAKLRKVQRDNEDGIRQFREGMTLYQCKGNFRELPYELIRIVNPGQVQTSRGAWVPLDQAKLLYRAIDSGRKILGAKVGHYTVTGVEERSDGDKVIRIGCHRILLSEARAVLGSRMLSLVTA